MTCRANREYPKKICLGTIAQLVEQRTFNPFVVGSTPAGPTKYQHLTASGAFSLGS